MNTTKQNIELAQMDLSAIRKIMEANHGSENAKANKALTFVNGFIAGLAAVLLGVEVFLNNQISDFIDVTKYDESLRLFTITYSGGLLVLILITGYLLLMVSGKNMGKGKDYFLNRVKVLPHSRFLSDLVIMFSFLAALIAGGKVAWVPAVLVMFLGNFALQGFIFKASAKVTLALGLTCYVGALAMIYFSSVSMIIPILGCLVMSGVSVYHLNHTKA